MERYASGTRCRHRSLVEYFGQPYDRASCAACDWCLKELDAVADSTTIARKILSCVARVKQTWGTGQVVDVLVGKANEKVLGARHHELSTFGLLKQESVAAVRGYIEQLIGDGLLRRDGDPYPVLRLTPEGLTLLKDGGECVLYRENAPTKSGERRRAKGSDRASLPVDHELFNLLRDVRLRLARERGVPPYVIFHDRSLQEMADRRPRTIADFHEIYGVGVKKAADFGNEFLDAIREFRRPY
jgi:ATP-dependent DNA helicase RecQ